MTFKQIVLGLLHNVVELFFPRYCILCGRRLASSESCFCSICLMAKPFSLLYVDNTDNDMARLFMGVIPIERAQSLMRYRPHSSLANAIYALKYNDFPEVGVVMGRIGARQLAKNGFFEGMDIIVPLPLAKRRQRQRGYNQCEMIAAGMAEVVGLPVCTTNVFRRHFVGSQTRLNMWERQSNVEDVFVVDNPRLFYGKHILLVDDILTTGATLKSCAKEIAARVGDVKISIFTLGRTSSL